VLFGFGVLRGLGSTEAHVGEGAHVPKRFVEHNSRGVGWCRTSAPTFPCIC